LNGAAPETKAKIDRNGAALTIELAPDLSAIGTMLDAIEAFLADNAVERSIGQHVMLAAEELVANAVIHGHAAEVANAIVLNIYCKPEQIVTQITYPGIEFDPTKPVERPPDRYAQPGGFGLELVWNAVDELTYRRRGNINIVRLSHLISR